MLVRLRNARVFAPEDLGLRDLLLGGGEILWMGAPRGSAAEPPPPELDLDLDLEGRRVVPGLIDLHAHVTGGGGEAGFASRVPPLPVSAFARAGITTVVGLLGADDITRSTAELLATVRALCEQGLSAYCYTGGYHVPPTTLTGSVRGDLVHLDRVIGVGELAISDHRSSQPRPDEVLRLAAEAHMGGLMTGKAGILHLHLGDGASGLDPVRACLDASEIPARVLHPTHVNRRSALLEEAFALTARGCTIDLTAFPEGDAGDQVGAASAWRRYAESGLPPELVTISSDGGGCMPVFDPDGRPVGYDVGRPATLLDTLLELLDAGVSLERALAPFTANPARLLRLREKGRVAVGRDADLLVLDERGRPTDVIARGRFLVRDGRTVDRAASPATEARP